MITQASVSHNVDSASIPQAPPTPAPAQINDEDALLRKLLEHPETRAKLRALLAEPAPAAAPAPAPVAAFTPVQARPTAPAPVAAPAVAPAPAQTPSPSPQTPPLSDMLTAAGWSFTPVPQTPAANVAMVPPAQPTPQQQFTIPEDVPMDDELRAMLAEPEFQKIALAVVGPESHDAFAQLVQQNARHLQGIPEA